MSNKFNFLTPLYLLSESNTKKCASFKFCKIMNSGLKQTQLQHDASATSLLSAAIFSAEEHD